MAEEHQNVNVEKEMIITIEGKRLNFKTDMDNLPQDYFPDIEYRSADEPWKKMFSEWKGSAIICRLCCTNYLLKSSFYPHIKGKKHQRKLELVSALKHPKIGVFGSTGGVDESDEEIRDGKFTEDVSKDVPVSDEKESLPDKDYAQKVKEFREMISSLSISDLKLIEYRFINTPWQKMIIEEKGTFSCTMCKIDKISDLFLLKQHVNKIKHQTNFDLTRGLYHPTFAPRKCLVQAFTRKPEVQPFNTEPEQSDTENTKEQSQDQGNDDSGAYAAAFTEDIPKMSLAEILQIEYLLKGETNFIVMFQKGINSYKLRCNLCDMLLGLEANLRRHQKGQKHIKNLDKASRLYHPKLFPNGKNDIDTEDDPDEVTIQEDNKNDSVITIEDSPERIIYPSKNANKNNLVINPMAVTKKTPNKLNDQTGTVTTPSPGKKIPVLNKSGKNTSTPVKAIVNKKSTPKTPEVNKLGRTQPLNMSAIKPKEPLFTEKTFSTNPNINSDIEGLIGVEYVVKILRDATDDQPRYECCLCEVELDGPGMQVHLTGINHRMKYLERHFPTCVRQFEEFRKDITARPMLTIIAHRIAIAIEKYHGRDLPFSCLDEEFRTNRRDIMSKVYSFKHSSELSGPSFTNVIDKPTLDHLIENKSTIKNPLPEPKRKPTFDRTELNAAKRLRSDNSSTLGVEEHKKLVDQFLKNTSLPDRNRRRSSSRGRYNSPGRYYRGRSRSPPRRYNTVWSVYKRMFDSTVQDIEDYYTSYRKDPETHPQYQNEWQIFWQLRSDELVRDGRDPSTYDFQAEWVLFWTKRMDEIYEEDIDNLKKRLRSRLDLPLHNEGLDNERYFIGGRKKRPSRFTQMLEDNHQIDSNLTSIQDNISMMMSNQMPDNQMQSNMIEYPMQTNMQSNMGYDRQSNYQMEHQSNIPQMHQQQQQQQQPQQHQKPQQQHNNPLHHMQQGNRSMNMPSMQNNTLTKQMSNANMNKDSGIRNRSPKKQPLASSSAISRNNVGQKLMNSPMDESIDTGPVTVVSVLRLLTALEEHLGILGPKVIELLIKAITVEKAKPNSADQQILTDENAVFLETVREKLRGQIVAGVLKRSKVRAVNQAIRDIGTLLTKANEMVPKNKPVTVVQPAQPVVHQAQPTPIAPPPPTNIMIPQRNEAEEKRELASKLANALAAQGKTNISSEQLQQLVAVYSLIEKKQRETNVPDPKNKNLSDVLAAFLKPSETSTETNITSQPIANTSTMNRSLNPQSSGTSSGLQTNAASQSFVNTGNMSQVNVANSQVSERFPNRVSSVQLFSNQLNQQSNNNNNNSNMMNQRNQQSTFQQDFSSKNQHQSSNMLSKPYNFSQLSQFDTSLSSFSSMPLNTSSSRQSFSNMNNMNATNQNVLNTQNLQGIMNNVNANNNRQQLQLQQQQQQQQYNQMSQQQQYQQQGSNRNYSGNDNYNKNAAGMIAYPSKRGGPQGNGGQQNPPLPLGWNANSNNSNNNNNNNNNQRRQFNNRFGRR